MQNHYIIAHIVGVTSLIRNEFITTIHKLTEGEVAIIDVDQVTKAIKNMPVFQKAVNKKDISKINEIWRSKFIEVYKKVTKNVKKDKIILIGSTVYLRYARTMINIPATLKIVLKYKPEQYAKEVITHYIGKYRDHIINGTFPLKYLNFKTLKDQYTKLVNIYTNKDYSARNEQTLFKLLMYACKKAKNLPSFSRITKLYLCSDEKFDGTIRPDKLVSGKIIAYTQEWLAALSVIPHHSKKYKKGFNIDGKKLVPFIKEIKSGAFEDLKKPTFMYQVSKEGFVFKESDRGYKLYSQQPVKIIKRTKVASVYKKLTQKHVNFISFNANK